MNRSGSRSSLIETQQVLFLSTGYEPLFKTNWKRAVTAIYSGRAEVIETHDTLWIGAGATKIQFPTIVRFLTGVISAKLRNVRRSRRPSKKNIWLRDNGKCQYCEKQMTIKECTIDHVIPKSRQGDHSWENVVLACQKCNQKKGNKLPKECNMFPLEKPKPPPRYVPFVR